MAVKSKDPQVDPVGACVGVRGSRVQNIIQELKGERIDIVPWDEEITRFVCNALSPAEIQKVVIDDQVKAIQVVVADENLSIAIGKRGQNVRLASQLTKWKLDIVSESEMTKRLAEAKFQLALIPGITETMAMALYQNGVEKVSDVAHITAEDLATVPGFDAAKAVEAIKNAKEVIASGKANASMPEEMLDYATRKKLNKGAKGDDAKADSGDGVSAIEAKLRAELAAAAEKNKGDNN